MLLIRFEALPSVRIAVLFCFPSYGHSKRKIPRQAVCLPWEMKGRLLRLAGFKPLPRRYRRGSDRRHRLQWWSHRASRRL